MERRWPDEALDFEDACRGALERAGGVGLARRCEIDPSLRAGTVRPMLDELGLLELDPFGGEEEASAAALAACAAGSYVLPYPLVQRLSVPGDLRPHVDAVYLADGVPGRLEHLDIAGRSIAVDIVSGGTRQVSATGTPVPMPLDPFGTSSETVSTDLTAGATFGAHSVLSAFWTVGALGQARDLAAGHARERRQFGRRIADFGAVQWHLSDIVVAHDSLWELACHSLARFIDDDLSAGDALALQVQMRESASDLLSHAHQVLAAVGLCEEHDLTVLTRHLQPVLRRPCSTTRVLSLLADEIEREGFDTLYPLSVDG